MITPFTLPRQKFGRWMDDWTDNLMGSTSAPRNYAVSGPGTVTFDVHPQKLAAAGTSANNGNEVMSPFSGDEVACALLISNIDTASDYNQFGLTMGAMHVYLGNRVGT